MTIIVSEEDKQRKVQNLQRYFGHDLDLDVLRSILEMNDWDETVARQFLEIQNEDQNQVRAYEAFVRNPNSSQASIPADFFLKPTGWIHPSKILNKDKISNIADGSSSSSANGLKKLDVIDIDFNQPIDPKNQKDKTADFLTKYIISLLLMTQQEQHAQEFTKTDLFKRHFYFLNQKDPILEIFDTTAATDSKTPKVVGVCSPRSLYLSCLWIMLNQGNELTHITKVIILACLWHCNLYNFALLLLKRFKDEFSLIEIQKALKHLGLLFIIFYFFFFCAFLQIIENRCTKIA